MNVKSRSDSARNSPRMKNSAIHTSATFTRNGIRELASDSASTSPAEDLPSTRRITTTTAEHGGGRRFTRGRQPAGRQQV